MSAHELKTASSTIQQVTVYERGAVVVRRATVTPGAVVVPDLPLLYGQESLRVVPHRGVVRNVRDTCTMDVAPSPESEDEQALQALELQLQLLDVAHTQNKELTALMAGISPEKQKSLKWSTLPHYDRWLEVLDAKQSVLQLLRDEARRLSDERDVLDEQRRDLTARSQTPTPRPTFRRGLAFSVDAPDNAPVDVDLTYFITGATWLPSYTLHIEGERAELLLAAHVAQATGEDWSGVQLRVCTGRYHAYQRAPELVSWRIGRQQPAGRAAYRPLPPGLDDLFLIYDKAQREHPVLPSAAVRSGRRPANGGVRRLPSDAFDDEDTGETYVASAVRLQRAAPAADHEREAVDGAPEPAYGAPPEAPVMTSALDAAPAPPMMAKRRSRAGGGGAPPGAAPADQVGANQVQNAVEMFDAQYLRLQDPEASQRGRLLSARLSEHLATLMADFDTDAHLRDLERTLRAMESAAQNVARQPVPPRSIDLGQTSFRRTYLAHAAASVDSDGQYHRVAIKRYPLSLKLEYRGVPHVDEQLYRTAVVDGASDPLPCGPIQVYENGAYLITAAIDEARADGALFLSLGPHPAVRVTDRSVRIHQSEKGLIGNKSCVDHHVEMTLRNALPHAVHAVLYGRLPQTDDNTPDVEVKLVESTLPLTVDHKGPQGETVAGGFSIPVTLEPASKLTLRYHFSITLPSKMELVEGIGAMLKLEVDTHFPIEAVTVFEDRGEVTRAGEVELPAGESVVVLEGITALFDPLRATVRGAAPGVVVDDMQVTYRRVRQNAFPADRADVLVEARRTLKTALQRAESDLSDVQAERQGCIELFRQWTARLGEPLFYSTDKGVDLRAGYDAARARLEDNRSRYEAAWRKVSALRQEMADVQRTLAAAAATPRGRLVADVHLRVSTAAAETTPLRLAYVIPCAVWRPAHEVETTAEATRWRTLGTVWQATGEPWTNVALRLSTERPHLNTALPTLQPDRLTLREKTEEEKRVIQVQHRAEAAAKDKGSRGVPGVNDGGEARFFAVPGRVEILPNGMPHQVHVDTFVLEARRRTVARPRHAAAAFDLLHLTHRPGMPLLAGPVTLMEDGAFAGRDTIGFVGSGEPFDLCFGRDRRVQVRRRLFHVDQERRLLSDIRHFVCVAEIRSLAATAVDLTVEFETPVSEVKQVQVVASEAHCTHGVTTPDDNGHIQIPVTVNAGQTIEVAYAFHFDTSGEVHIPDPW